MKDLHKNINLKIGKYTKFPHKLFFVIGNDAFSQQELDTYTANKRKALPQYCRIINLKELESLITPMTAYSKPF
jgi:hypothetical protein